MSLQIIDCHYLFVELVYYYHHHLLLLLHYLNPNLKSIKLSFNQAHINIYLGLYLNIFNKNEFQFLSRCDLHTKRKDYIHRCYIKGKLLNVFIF